MKRSLILCLIIALFFPPTFAQDTVKEDVGDVTIGEASRDSSVGNISPPRFKRKVPPIIYPSIIRNRIEGVVKVKVLVSKRGYVKRAITLNDLGHGSKESAVSARKRFRYYPAMKNGEPIAV